MAKKYSRQFLTDSCVWIREHWNAKNHEVPDDLLEAWIYPSGDEHDRACGYHLAVFIFGYMNHRMKSETISPETGHRLSMARTLELFQAWQCKLALSELHRRTDMKVSASDLFDFSENEEFKVWRQ
jgi:hypothetical protein